MPFSLSERDLARLEHVHPDLVAVVKRAAEISSHPFMVVEGIRSIARQRQLVADRKSKTMNSRHIAAKNGFGHAVDLAPVKGGKIDWNDHRAFGDLAVAVKRAALDLGVDIEWGGDWSGAWDKPHWQLPWKSYPGNSIASLGSSRTMRGIMGATVGQGIDQGADSLGGGVQALVDTLSPTADAIPAIAKVVAILKIAGVIITIAGLAYAAYARWDDAGRPIPSFLRRSPSASGEGA